MLRWWRRWVSREVSRVRRNGVAAVRWSSRITLAATAAYVVALLFFPGTEPLLAPLTAMLVVQVTPLSLLASGLDRVVAVVAGVSLAVGFASVVPLRWWSLGVLIFVAITIGQYLRLRANLVEVAISAMLVLGVGSLDAEAAAWQRIAETLVGAAVGVLLTLVFPPRIAGTDTGRELDAIADALSALLTRAAEELQELAGADPDPLPGAARDWLEDARRITHDLPRAGAALLQLEESRRLNVRAVRAPLVEPGLRQGMEALEHTAVAVRAMMRTVADVVADGSPPDAALLAAYADLARVLRAMAGGVDAFGELVRNEGDVRTQLSRADVDRLRAALDDIHAARGRYDAVPTDVPAHVAALHAEIRSTLSRLLRELDLDERVRRQLRLIPPRRPGMPRRRSDPPPPPGDDDTVVLPPVRDHPRPRRPR